MAAIAATEKEPERKDENPEPTIGAPAPMD
jgi:hypothetical protein